MVLPQYKYNKKSSMGKEALLIDANDSRIRVNLRYLFWVFVILALSFAIWFFYIRHTSTLLVCTNIPRELRFDCHPEDGASEASCQSRGCCWDPSVKNRSISGKVPLDIPYCFYPSSWKLYNYKSFVQSNNDFSGDLVLSSASFYKNDLRMIRMNSVSISSNTLRVKIYDPKHRRYEPRWPVREDYLPFQPIYSPYPNYRFVMNETKPGFRVERTGQKNTAIFDSLGSGGFIFADQFLQISTLLPSSNIYGLGEHRSSLKLNTNWQSFTLFNKDQPPTESANLYGSHPFYLVMEESGDCHGVLFLNSNAMDVILQPTPALTFRSIGGIFDLYFFMGPTPADVLKQYSDLIGKPFMPPFWSLGFHLCRFGYKSVLETANVWNKTLDAGIPLDTQWNDLDYMSNNNDFTYNNETFKRLPYFVEHLHKFGGHYIPLIDPGISASEAPGSYPPFDEGIKRDIFIKDAETKLPFIGKVWNRVSTVWPDFTHPNATEYWYTMMKSMHDQFPYDGAWIDMNEISNFYDGKKDGCSINSLDFPPFLPNIVGDTLSTKTLCMDAQHYSGSHYNVHNTYGTAEAEATQIALTKIRGKRPFIVSRATWIGHGVYAAHWTGDVFSTWHDLRMSVPEILAFSFFQIPMVGADICGFNGNTTASLCSRWMQLGAFYPFARNHNSDDTIAQDPVSLGPLVVESSKRALSTRYKFLPYLYTLFYRAHSFGETVARPLFIEFPEDRKTWSIDSQFLWGSAFLIVPIFEENPPVVEFYLPRGIWYNLHTTLPIISTGKLVSLPPPPSMIPILLRGGFIFPTKNETMALTTTGLRDNHFQLYIAPDSTGHATGELYWDDGDSLDSMKDRQYRWIRFTYQNRTLSTEEIKPGLFNEPMEFNLLKLMGSTQIPTRVTIDGEEVPFRYDNRISLTIQLEQVIDLRANFILSWE